MHQNLLSELDLEHLVSLFGKPEDGFSLFRRSVSDGGDHTRVSETWNSYGRIAARLVKVGIPHIAALLDDMDATNGPATRALPSGEIVMAVPVSGRPEFAAVGMVTADPARLARRLAEATMNHQSQLTARCETERHVEMFTERLSANLDELAWLRTLSQNLKFCVADNRLHTIADRIFPTLRDIISAEAVLLVESRTPGGICTDLSSDISFPVWIGDRVLSPSACAEFVNCIASGASGKPFVWNFRNKFGEMHTEETQIRSSVMVQIGSETHHHGWILALNKVLDPAIPEEESYGRGEFGSIEATLLESAARILATHASNIELFQEQRSLTVNTIRSLINVVDARDRYTCGHSDRVALMARSLARCLGESDADIDQIYLSGLLHDIGKVSVPDDILLKPGRLTDEEFEEIKKHPERGVEILQHIKQLHPVLPGVLYHHEAWDGSGYPAGLSGESIPLMGRILAVVDAFDAITTCRPYQKARTRAQALEIVSDGAGRQWDPKFVDAFINNLDSIVSKSDEWESHISEILNPQYNSDRLSSWDDEQASVAELAPARATGAYVS